MKAYVSSKIYVEEPTKAVRDWCKANLVVTNPEYEKKIRMGLWARDTPERFYLYEETDKHLIIPFGCASRLHGAFPEMPFVSRIRPSGGIEYGSRINLFDYQKDAAEAILAARNGILVMPCGAGKGLPVDAKICTPTGWKRNGDLKIGDAVIGSDGKATRVTGVFDRGEVSAYKITFSDGVETICDKDHLWMVQKQSQRAESHNWDVMDAQSIYDHYQNMKCRSQYLYIPIVDPVEFYCYSRKDLIMNPWLLGFLLGDGCFQKDMVTMSTSEEDLRQKVIDIITKEYNALEWLTHKGKYDWRFCGGYTLHGIESLGLGRKHSYEKFIPEEYLYGSVETRLAVLQGLFDADGHISNGTVFEYCTTSKRLADDVVFVVESLGGTAKVSEKTPKYTYAGEKRTGRKAYRIFFKLYRFKPFTSEKHSAAYRDRKRYKEAYRIIKKIEPCETIISRCITVDAKDQLYVTEHFVVTHNTQTALEVIARIGRKALWLTHTQDLLTQSMERAKSVLDIGADSYGTITGGAVNVGRGITFATVQTMSRIDLAQYKDEWGVIVVDECLPGNTKIMTDCGEKELMFLSNGDEIASYNRNTDSVEYKPVTNTFKLKAHDIVKITLENGEVIYSTGNHPFFTDGGWLEAKDIIGGKHYVMQLLWSGNRRKQAVKNKPVSKQATGLGVLLKGLFNTRWSRKGCLDGRQEAEIVGKHETNKRKISRADCRQDEKSESYAKSRGSGKGFETLEGNRASSKNKMWKRTGSDCTTADVSYKVGGFYGCLYGISDSDKNEKKLRIPNLLQGRHSDSGRNACYRSRRKLALCNRETETRREKGYVYAWVRVESVEVQKQTSDGTFGGLCPDGYVYNIEVADNNNYFANGILVHNCHKAVGSPTKAMQFYKVLSALSCRYKIGVTATPKRGDGMSEAMFALLGDIVHEVPRSAVAENTCPVEVRFVLTGYVPEVDIVLCGDGTINYSELVKALVNNNDRFYKVLDEVEKAADEGSVLVLGSRVDYLQRMNQAFSRPSICLSGMGNSKKAKAERKEALRQLNDGEIQVLFGTYQLAAEGLDIPNLKFVIFATPEKDSRIVQQSAGRVERKAEGKKCGVIIDFVDDFGMYKGWYKKRLSIYKKSGYAIME